MVRDPKIVGRAKVGAEMLAEVVNGFVEPISWKTLVCVPIAYRLDGGFNLVNRIRRSRCRH